GNDSATALPMRHTPIAFQGNGFILTKDGDGDHPVISPVELAAGAKGGQACPQKSLHRHRLRKLAAIEASGGHFVEQVFGIRWFLDGIFPATTG
ncbi:MAG TPA: hypothetical protein VJL59_03350, partial [Anaerolineales bacterium]|nr:hypothetical protein [Anaerolineales bacterium]